MGLSRRALAGAAAAVAAAVSLFVALPSLASVQQELLDASAGWAGAAVGLELLSCLSFVVVFRLAFAGVAPQDGRALAWTSMGASVLLPGGGVAGLAAGGWLMHAAGAPARTVARRASALFFLTSACSVAAVGVAGLALLAGAGGPEDRWLAGLPVLGAAAVTVAVLALPRIGARGRRAGVVLEGIGDARRSLLRPSWRVLGALGWLAFDIAVLWATLHALGEAPPPAALVLAYTLGYLANALPVPAGIGVLDAGLAGALVLYGTPAAPAAGAVLVYRAIAFWVPALGGLAAYARLRSLRLELGHRRAELGAVGA